MKICSSFLLNNLEIETNREIEWRMRNDWLCRKRSIYRYDRVIVVKSDSSGRGSGGSTSGTRPFGQPLVLMSQESSSSPPSTSTSLRTPEVDVLAQRGANKKRWRCVASRRTNDALARVHQVHTSTDTAIDLFSSAIRPQEHPEDTPTSPISFPFPFEYCRFYLFVCATRSRFSFLYTRILCNTNIFNKYSWTSIEYLNVFWQCSNFSTFALTAVIYYFMRKRISTFTEWKYNILYYIIFLDYILIHIRNNYIF